MTLRRSLQSFREEAIKRLFSFLASRGLKPEVLSPEQLEQYKERNAYAGFELRPQLVRAPEVELRIFVDSEFPFSLPKFAVSPVPPSLKYPHIDNDGYLCLEEGRFVADESEVEKIAEECINDAFELIEKCYSRSNQGEFRDEFLSYWIRHKKNNHLKTFSILNLKESADSRKIKVGKWRGFDFLCEDERSGKRWIENRDGKYSDVDWQDGILLRLPYVLRPDEYPTSSSEALELIRRNCSDKTLQILGNLAAENPRSINIIFTFSTKDGVVAAGVKINRSADKPDYRLARDESFKKGFRPGHLPVNVALKRYFQHSDRTDFLTVERLDADWVLGRDINKNLETLRARRVVMVGCGSVGSAVLRLIVQAGISKIILIDPDHLEAENSSRHSLGQSAIETRGGNKASLLKQSISGDFPHCEISAFGFRWQEVAERDVKLFEDAELIISTVGDWPSENALNKFASLNDINAPILYGWTEPFGCAGHGFVNFKSNSCFNCLFDKSDFKMEMSEFSSSVVRQAVCGGVFQPYGAIDMMPTCVMIAELATDILVGDVTKSQVRSWLGSTNKIRKNFGAWSPIGRKLVESHGDGTGSFMISTDITQEILCDSCREKELSICDLRERKK